jgi:serine/threonine-protein kinase
MPVEDPRTPGEIDPLIGQVLSDRYRILRKIGQGGMGVVYLSEHALIEKKIALKVLFPELTRRAELVARFLQEAKSASRIDHENVIGISDFGQLPDGLVYIAMEYLDGVDLGQILRTDGAIPWERARPILMQIAKGLRAAHEHGIIHRDMKPENVFVIQREGRPDFIKVLDFGIAKVVGLDGDGPRLTQAGAIFGTPEYMSPEQAQGQMPDHRVDVYALGCLMYQMLTGVVPFQAESFMAILAKHMMEPVTPLRQRRPDLDIPEEVERIAMRALAKERDQRWPDMNAFHRALGSAGEEGRAEPSRPNAAPVTAYVHRSPAEPNAGAGAADAAAAAPADTVLDPPPGSPGPSRRAIAGGVAAVLLVGAGAIWLALRSPAAPSALSAPSPSSAAASSPTGPAAPAAAGARAPSPSPSPPAAPSAAGTPAATPASAGEEAVKAPARVSPSSHRAGAGKSITPPAERPGHPTTPPPAAAPEEPSTPAELKNPFSSP